MAERPDPGQVGPPSEYPQVNPPRDLHPTADIRFVIAETAKLTANVERLVRDVERMTDKVSDLSRSVDRFRTTAVAIGACLGVFLPVLGTVLWWAVGERINSVLRPSAPAYNQSTQDPSRLPPPSK